MKRKYLIITLLFLAIGFAAVSTTLFINGTSVIKKNSDDFKVYYSDALVNGKQDLSVVVDDTHLSFKTTLDTLGQTYVLDYDVTNSSKQYDAALTMNCTGGNEYLTVVNSFDTANNLLATDTRRGTLTLTLAKSYSGSDLDVEITCTLGANAVERNSMATGTPKEPVKVCKWEYEDLNEDSTLSVGDRYARCEDAFYVTNVDGNEVEMLTASALTSEYRQEVPGTTVADYVFFNDMTITNNWYFPESPIDLDIQVYSKNHIAPYVNGYVDYLKQITGDNTLSGDLITYTRLTSLCSGFVCNFEWMSLGYEEQWWSKTVSTVTYPSVKGVKENLLFDIGVNYLEPNEALVRPVITISKDTLDRLTNTNPLLDAQTFCELKGYSYGFDTWERPSDDEWESYYYETGDLGAAKYYCSEYEDPYEDLYGLDANGNRVYWFTNDGPNQGDNEDI